jgi:hypothetical protein
MNMVKNVLFLVAKFQNHVFVKSKYGANNIEGCLIFFLNFFVYPIFKNCLMDDHDFSYFIILNKKHTNIHTQFDTLRSNSNKSKINFFMEGK